MNPEQIRGHSETKEPPLDGAEQRLEKKLSELPESFGDLAEQRLAKKLSELPESFGASDEKHKSLEEFRKRDEKSGRWENDCMIHEENPMVGHVPDWKHIETEHNRFEDLRDTNPNYTKGREWQVNCQRCVPTYEMRRRGFDVTAKPAPPEASKHLAYHPFDAWKNPDVKHCKGSGISDIQDAMKKWGDGARAQVVVYWKGGCGGHTFIAERVNGETHFIDPQTGKEGMGVEKYFDHVIEDRTQFCRIDDKEASTYILDCCKEREI